MQFFDNPLINIIAQHRVMNDGALFLASGMKDKSLFKTAFQHLIDEGHIIVGYHDRIYPRCLSLTVIDKLSGMYLREIFLNYISRDELKNYITYDEEGEEYVDGCYLELKHREFIEERNDIKLDFDKYNYRFLVGYENLDYEPPVLKRQLSIVYIDSFWLYASGVKKTVRDVYFPDIDWNYFVNPEDALAFIERRFASNEPVNLILTEAIHPGMDCNEFSQVVRQLEDDYNMFPIPIIPFSLVGKDNPIIKKGFSGELYEEYYIDKTWEAEAIGGYLKGVLAPNPYLR